MFILYVCGPPPSIYSSERKNVIPVDHHDLSKSWLASTQKIHIHRYIHIHMFTTSIFKSCPFLQRKNIFYSKKTCGDLRTKQNLPRKSLNLRKKKKKKKKTTPSCCVACLGSDQDEMPRSELAKYSRPSSSTCGPCHP